MRLRLLAFLFLLLLFILDCATVLASPFETPDRATLGGPGIVGERTITEPSILAILQFRELDDTVVREREISTEPTNGTPYLLTRYLKKDDGTLFVVDRLRYYPGQGGTPGRFFYQAVGYTGSPGGGTPSGGTGGGSGSGGNSGGTGGGSGSGGSGGSGGDGGGDGGGEGGGGGGQDPTNGTGGEGGESGGGDGCGEAAVSPGGQGFTPGDNSGGCGVVFPFDVGSCGGSGKPGFVGSGGGVNGNWSGAGGCSGGVDLLGGVTSGCGAGSGGGYAEVVGAPTHTIIMILMLPQRRKYRLRPTGVLLKSPIQLTPTVPWVDIRRRRSSLNLTFILTRRRNLSG